MLQEEAPSQVYCRGFLQVRIRIHASALLSPLGLLKMTCVLFYTLSRLLFWYLEGSIGKTLKWLYPTSPDRADEWLANEIYR